MAMSTSNSRSRIIGCDSCNQASRDDGTWTKWTDPYGDTLHICHSCLSGPRYFWKERFLLCEKASFGTLHLPRGLHTTELEAELLLFLIQRSRFGQEEAVQMWQKLDTPYVYPSSLDDKHIRVLTVLPGDGDIFCTLEVRDFGRDRSDYEALSYSWGDPTEDNHIIWIDCHPHKVRPNLHAALTRLRKPTQSRKFWIDAICINQEDQNSREKTLQIPLMGRIYCQAARVVIWLGEVADGSDAVMDIIQNADVKEMEKSRFVEDLTKMKRRTWFYRTWIVQEIALCKYPPQLYCGSKSVSFGQFMATCWFLDQLMRSSQKLDPDERQGMPTQNDTAAYVTAFAQSSEDFTLNSLENVRLVVLDNDGDIQQQSLVLILQCYKQFKATDLRDKIYGVLGLTNQEIHQFLQVNYDKTPAKVYCEAMTYMLEKEIDNPHMLLIFLEYALPLALQSPLQGLPSWVPDFSKNNAFLFNDRRDTWFWRYQLSSPLGPRRLLFEHQRGRHEVYIDRVDRDAIRVNGDRLHVQGTSVDVIEAVKESRFFLNHANFTTFVTRESETLHTDSEETNQFAETLRRQIQPPDVSSVPIRPDFLGMAAVACLERMFQVKNLWDIDKLCREAPGMRNKASPNEWMAFIWKDLFEGFDYLEEMSEEYFMQEFHRLAGNPRPSSSLPFARLMENFRDDIDLLESTFRELFSGDKCFFTTRTSEFYGICPKGVKRGDRLVFLFPPVFMCFILRQYGTDFQMVGPCLVPPFVRQRFLQDISRSGSPLEQFIIV